MQRSTTFPEYNMKFYRKWKIKMDWNRTQCHEFQVGLFHTELQPGLDFWLAHEAPLVPGGHMDPNKLEFENLKILSARPPEILTPMTPGVSHGTKNFSPKIFSYDKNQMLFYTFWGFVM